MAIKNASTSVDYWKTLGEIHAALAKAGADHVNIRHEEGLPVGMSFSISVEGFPVNFLLPCEVEGVRALVQQAKEGRKLYGAKNLDDKVLRVAWRIIKDWVEAQVAFIEARNEADKMRALATVFLPYAVNQKGETLAQKMLNSKNLKQLSDGTNNN